MIAEVKSLKRSALVAFALRAKRAASARLKAMALWLRGVDEAYDIVRWWIVCFIGTAIFGGALFLAVLLFVGGLIVYCAIAVTALEVSLAFLTAEYFFALWPKPVRQQPRRCELCEYEAEQIAWSAKNSERS